MDLDLPTVSSIPGPLGSFTRHVTTVHSLNVPNYVTTARFPVDNITQLKTDPTFENIVAHQSYLDKLQFGQHSMRSWSNMIQDHIVGEADQAHNDMAAAATR